jgi:hypothetical protein
MAPSPATSFKKNASRRPWCKPIRFHVGEGIWYGVPAYTHSLFYSTSSYLPLLFSHSGFNRVFIALKTLALFGIYFSSTSFAAKLLRHFRITTLTASFRIAFLVVPRCKRQKRRYRAGNDAFPLCNAQKQSHSLISLRISRSFQL